MNLFESMGVFVSVAELKSFSAAARKHAFPLTTTSRKIAELEQYLGVRLFQRTTRRLELTPSGTAYLQSCLKILEEVQAADQLARGEYSRPKGTLTLTASVVFGKSHILPIVADFLRAFPEINVRLILSDKQLDLVEDRIDLAIRIGVLTDSSLVAKRVGEIRRVLCATPKYLETYGTPRSLKDLSEHQLISTDSLGGPLTFRFKKGKVSVPALPRLSVTNAEAGIAAAVAGVGITSALSYQVNDLLRAGKLRLVLENDVNERLPVHVLRVPGKTVPRKTSAFLEFLLPRLHL